VKRIAIWAVSGYVEFLFDQQELINLSLANEIRALEQRLEDIGNAR